MPISDGPDPPQDPLRSMRDSILQLKHDQEFAEAQATELNRLARQISHNGMAISTSILGPILQSRPYPPAAGGHTSGVLIQAAIVIPGGLGVVVWDSENYCQLEQIEDALAAGAPSCFVPFENCQPVFRALLGPHIKTLALRLLEHLNHF